jgi:hypothetical protein
MYTQRLTNRVCQQGYMYWRLLSTNPSATRDIVLSEKPPISTETDRMDKGMLDQVRRKGRIQSSRL